eukprot:COSAG05_NODE_530_length_8907_cov_8.972298_7_plen_71_part_00
MQSMRRRRHAHIHDLKSRYVENISLFHAYARKNKIWILAILDKWTNRLEKRTVQSLAILARLVIDFRLHL